MDFSPASLRARFHVLRPMRDAIRAQSAPLRQERDAIEAEARAKIAPIDARIKELEAPLEAIKQEMAIIVRALDGKTGPAPTED